jgi:LPXTG-motif cell wall-anchored protein
MDTSMLVRTAAGVLALVVAAVIIYRRKQKA